MARARITTIKNQPLTSREKCSHLVKDHAVLAHSPTKKVLLCTRCGAHFIVAENGKPTRKRVFSFEEEAE